MAPWLEKRIDAAKRFLKELRRRKVIKVGIVYGVVAGVIIEVGANTFEALLLPEWALTLVIVLTILGFPIALVLAWALEVTPTGIRAERGQEATAEPAPPAQPAQPSRAARYSALPPRPPRPRAIPTAPAADNSAAPDPDRSKRAVIAGLRHDLRTPMNAVMGYGSVLVMEAAELGVTALVPDIQRLQSAAKSLLDRIDQLLPSGPEAADVDVSAIRGRLHTALLGPATELVDKLQALLESVAASEHASADVERQLGAARKLLALVQQLARPQPAAAESPEQRGFERVFDRLRPGAQPALGELHAGTLLVVDDNAMNRDLMTRQLVREGYGVFTAASGKEALQMLRVNDFDLVLLDVMMAEMDGVQVLEQIQGDPALCEIPVVMMSALDEMDSVARCIEKGALDYFAKPFDPVLLRARVAATLQLSQLRQELRRAEDELAQNRRSIGELVRSVVPRPLSDGLERGERSAGAQYPEVTAVVARLEGLDAIASRSGPDATLARMSKALALFEECSLRKGLQIVRATERSYTAIVGAPEWKEDHAKIAADYALDLLDAVRKTPGADGLDVRIALNTGALVAGVADGYRLVFGMWGDAVNTADAIARQASAGGIQVSAATCAKLRETFDFGTPVMIEVPGRGHLHSYQLTGRKAPPPAS